MTYEEAKRQAYKRLSMRAYHSIEMRRYLTEKGASAEIIAQVIEELKRLGYINDNEWVAGMIRSLSSRKYGPKAIGYKLHLKGIPQEEVIPHLKLLGGQHEQIRLLIDSKYKGRDLSLYKERQKVVSSLIRKGYDPSEVIEVIESK